MTFPEKIVLASGNAGKVKEFTRLFSERNVTVIPQKELGVTEVPETGTTFVENAIIKARHAARETGLPAIADDSGLVVNALGGAPGIYSARYAGEDALDTDNVQKLLTTLSNNQDRRAHFFCMLVFMRHKDDPVPLISEGYWHGTIAHEVSGTGGFGYDPVFHVPSHHCTAAELDRQVKNAISHRGQAMTFLLEKMRQTFA
ncbi:RdgB/HAM1 family non-canonical purine NTP pyrophosphatase [Aestuariibacter sp. A3R04]|uniref:RdgB/HAM1 family non-canonical purine NTP pyrophosphatase n=1 Tax=Aestuariibacter sp. A3R04 TaxID=2841571 RepID=UPI001C0878D4|nr:RdgB/HAM1 family non-canonical purine NTP pyrophosphatase [Aestuariibacter sp. A3R04]MBU3022062.1 RdgB/HAM1 family non-canonical purine NTP pyrophosphatase [Aestuariibacter sp. A3R04]